MSSLSAQLSRIATAEKRGSDKFTSSFLFDAKQAADYDLESIFALGSAGLADLEQLDERRFGKFRRTLFSEQIKGFDRALKTAEENALLDESIMAFMQCLSQYFLTTAAGKCIEWLLRRFRVNEFNVNAILACALPFHETPQFAKLASLLRFGDNSIWGFIRNLRRPIRPLAREMLVDQCVREPALLRAIGDMVRMLKKRTAHKTLYAFYAATAVRVLQRTRNVTDNLVALLLPLIADGLQQQKDNDYRVTAMIVLCQLAERATFATDALSELMLAVAAPMPSDEPTRVAEATLCLLHLSRCQENAPEAFSDALVDIFMMSANFVEVTLVECASKFDISTLVLPLLSALQESWAMADDVLGTLSLNDSTVYHVAERLLERAAAARVPSGGGRQLEQLQGVRKCLDRLRLLYPERMTQAVDTAMKVVQKDSAQHKSLYNFLASTMKGTSLQMVSQSDTPLFLALNHADADVRSLAIRKLGDMMKRGQVGSDGELFVEDALLTRLRGDDDENTITAVLKLPHLGKWIDHDRLFAALQSLTASTGECSLLAAQCMLENLLAKSKKKKEYDASRANDVLRAVLPCLLIHGSLENTRRLAELVTASTLVKDAPLKEYAPAVVKLEKMLQEDQFSDTPSLTYNSKLVQILSSATTEQKGDRIVDILRTYLISGSDQAVLLALLVMVNSLASLQSGSANASNVYILSFAQDNSAKEVHKLLTGSGPIADLLPATVVWALRSVVHVLQPPASAVCWQAVVSGASDDAGVAYGHAIRTVFLTVHQEEDMSLFDTLIKELFSRHLAKSALSFLSAIWGCPDYTLLVRLRSLGIAHVFLLSAVERKEAVDFQLLLPHLLVAFADQSKAVRSMAGKCLSIVAAAYKAIETAAARSETAHKKKKQREIFADIYDQTTMYGAASEHLLYLPTASAIAFAFNLASVSEEMIADPGFLARHLAAELFKDANGSRSSERHKEALLAFLVTNIIAVQDTRIRKQLLVILQSVHNPLKLRHLTPLILALPSLGDLDPVYAQLLVECFDDQSSSLLNVKSSPAKQAFFGILSGTLLADVTDETSISMLQQQAALRVTHPFFEALTENRKQQLFSQLMELTLNASANVVTDVRGILRDIRAPAKVVVHELLRCQQSLAQTIGHGTKRARVLSNGQTALANALQHAVAILELLQYHEPSADEDLLVLPLFDMLAVTLSTGTNEASSLFEYVNQLVLSAITRILGTIRAAGVVLDANRVRVDLVVQCIRGTTNPQTHGQALLLLAALAAVHPDLVLQNVMSVFTFMGASVLRQDDNYSFHIIQQTLEKVIPPLVAARSTADITESVKSIISVFVDALFHIPRHRRLRMFTVLVSTLGQDQFLHATLALLLAKYVERISKSTEDADTLMEFSLSLAGQFSAGTQLQSLHALAAGMLTIPNEKPSEKELNKVAKACAACFFDIKKYSTKQIRQFKWAVLDLARQQLESRAFLSQLVSTRNSATGEATLEEQYLGLSEALLRLVDSLFAHERSLASRGDVNVSIIKQWRGVIRLANDVLNNVNRLLSLPSFMRIICELLKHENPSIRRKSMLLFNEKVEALEEGVDIAEKDLFLGMLPHLTAMIAIKARPRDREAMEIAINKQTALVSLALLVKHFGRTDASAFMDVLSVITGEWALGHENRQVAASSIICLSVYCRELGPRVVPLLPRFMPVVLGYMETATEQSDASHESATLMKLSTLGLVDVMARHMPMFTSPYLPAILRHVFSPAFIGTGAEARSDQVATRTNAVLSQLATRISPRLLLPPTFACFEQLVVLGKQALLPYYAFIGKMVDAMERADVQQNYKPIFKFFLNLSDIRRTSSDRFSIQELRELEEGLIDAFLRLVMKLNETTFKPVFLKAVEWAISTHDAVTNKQARQIFFYRFLDQLLERLKSIVVPYYVYVLDDVIGKLAAFKTSPSKLDTELWPLLLSSVQKCLLYDNDGFWTTSLAEKTLPSLADQLEVQASGEDDAAYLVRISAHLVPCLGQLAVTSGTDVVWKPLNTQVLLKTRNDRPAVRIAALQVVQEFYTRLGEEFLILLPETIPFLAELMEDDDVAVERLTQEVIAVIERYLGESLQKYFE
ncbi:hypothetical protein THASP1DRAFT_19205 [Thamnocephalis sphaerospora]|uniref:U3 small nucleolar RNA-associated protein 10 n=1 Tax=Thamnocephalis sphaerospora TaxID=78915 RepID=A0A4P9XJE2_9FUNG|nr:hypothetical protein THASP1DRAFT_19205 [Thamnocephalis sphaerospora]|eukprot:RKP05884.1 hypothetical protein THASP1DRAFT_19205 [Thamnocephalis sphaerospora]